MFANYLYVICNYISKTLALDWLISSTHPFLALNSTRQCLVFIFISYSIVFHISTLESQSGIAARATFLFYELTICKEKKPFCAFTSDLIALPPSSCLYLLEGLMLAVSLHPNPILTQIFQLKYPMGLPLTFL